MKILPTALVERIFEQVKKGKHGSGGICNNGVVFQGFKYEALETHIVVNVPGGKKLQAHHENGVDNGYLCVLFKRSGEGQNDPVSFVVVSEKDEVLTSSEEGATGYFYAMFLREGKKAAYGMAVLSAEVNGNRFSDLVFCDEPDSIAFLRSVYKASL